MWFGSNNKTKVNLENNVAELRSVEMSLMRVLALYLGQFLTGLGDPLVQKNNLLFIMFDDLRPGKITLLDFEKWN